MKNSSTMKNLFSFLLLLAFTATIQAQPLPTVRADQQRGETLRSERVSFANPYIGMVKLSYNFDEDRPVDDNLVFSAGAQFTPISGDNWAVPIVGVGSIGSGNLLADNSGLNFGIWPYYMVSQGEKTDVVLHGGANYKVITAGVQEGEKAPQQVKALIGIEVITGEAGRPPFTFSFSGGIMNNSNEGGGLFSRNIGNAGLIEADLILPVANGLGLLVEGVFYLRNVSEDDIGSQMRAGVLTTF